MKGFLISFDRGPHQRYKVNTLLNTSMHVVFIRTVLLLAVEGTEKQHTIA